MTEGFFQSPPYGLPQAEKQRFLLPILNALTQHHRERCAAYRQILDVMHPQFHDAESLEQLPWLPVGLFKSHRLVSVPDTEVVRTLTSSGTSGQAVSRIELDRQTASNQTQALAHIMGEVLGKSRLPMILVDTRSLLKDRSQFSARAAGVLGMMNLGRAHFWALDEQMQLDRAGLDAFLDQYGDQPFLIFGFTFMVWQYLLQQVRTNPVDLGHGVLIHSGGWKKLQDQAISNAEFKAQFAEITGLRRVHNFYGMVEQVGSVFLEGSDGRLHAPYYADVIVRSPDTWEPCGVGQPGVLQVLSALPGSYPGHCLLTEDLGVVHAIDPGDCPWRGKAFEVLGRVPKAELRGCSDVHAMAHGGST